MMHDTPCEPPSDAHDDMGPKMHQWLMSLPGEPGTGSRKRGRPPMLSSWHLSLAVLVSVLGGLQSQLEIWRLIAFSGVGSLPVVLLSDQAVYDRLAEDGVSAFQAFFAQVSCWVAQLLAPYEDRTLAPFARAVVALDESTLDRVKRWVKWRRLDVLLDASANCKVHARAMLSSLATGTLILFDRGYFSFAWLDELTKLGYWYISRTVGKTRYQVLHIFYQADGVFDALVYVGVHHSDRVGEVARLVCFRVGTQPYSYLTNVLDPAQLSMADIARLYGRRWDIELAFRELKEHLGLRLLWSAKLGVIHQQVWASLILAQLLHAFQVELAARAGVDPFDVSLALLSRHVPRLLLHGRAMGLIRPSTRTPIQAPIVPLQEVSYPPPELIQPRPARSAHRKCGSRYAAQS